MATTPHRDMGTLLGMAHSLPKCVPQSMEIIHLEVHPLPTIPFFRSCGSKPCAVFIVRGAQVRRGCLCLVGVWTIHLKHSEIYVCQKMAHFSPIFLGVKHFLNKNLRSQHHIQSVFLNIHPTTNPFSFENSTLSINVINPSGGVFDRPRLKLSLETGGLGRKPTKQR